MNFEPEVLNNKPSVSIQRLLGNLKRLAKRVMGGRV
jgi:hypothetical protein